MKKLSLLLVLFCSAVMFPLQSFAEWTEMGESTGGNTFYIDFTTIRKENDNVYWWDLTNYKNEYKGAASFVSYNIGDCKVYRLKTYELAWYDKKWGEGNVLDREDNMKWLYPRPSSIFYRILDTVCNQ